MVAKTPKRLQGKFTINNQNPNEEHMLIAIRDITEIERERSEISTTMRKNITIKSSIDIQTKFVCCDTVKIKEVFLNLMSNAIKYTPEGGTVLIDTKEIPSHLEGYAIIQTTISDSGIGMSPEFLKVIFDEFSREHHSEKNRIEGTGLGMSIVKHLVNLMNGSIDVKSELGKGTSFIVTLPHRKAHESDIHQIVKSEISKDLFQGKKILLAEDNDLNAEITVELLKEYGFEFERARDGVECVDMLLKSKPHVFDFILMDIQMPNMDGYKATKLIRNFKDEKRNIPIFAMTANAFEEDKKNALKVGMNAHFAKPLQVLEMVNTMKDFLKEKV